MSQFRKLKSQLYKISHSSRRQQIISYITDHYSEPLSTEQMAKVCEFSESHFIKFFKSTIGITFTECLNSYRLSQAARLLLADTDEPIMDIARRCGFNSIPHFNRVFKKKYGITPSALRGTKSSPEKADPSLS